MYKFDFNGRNYKVVNGLVHASDEDNGILDPCYRGDNVMLDAHCDVLAVKLYQRPDSIHTHGHQKGEPRKPVAYTKKWVPVYAKNKENDDQ